MRGKNGEVVETVSRRKIDVLVQEIRWRGFSSARKITGKDTI